MRKLLIPAGVFLLTLGSATAGFYLHKFTSQPDQFNHNIDSPAVLPATGLTGTTRPDFTLIDLNGVMRNVSEWDGKVVALNFWATWCPPCLQEIPEFISLQDRYSHQGLQFVGIALHTAEEVREFVQNQNMNYPVLVGELEVIELAHAYGNEMGTLPYTVIIDRDKRINFIKNGQLSGEKAEEVITNLL